MLLVTIIDTFYNGLTLRHRDTINAAAGGTFMKRTPEECYDLIENMTAHHNFWDSSAERNDSCKSVTPANTEIAALTRKFDDLSAAVLRIHQTNHNQQNKTISCETCGGPHPYHECQASGGFTQENIFEAQGSYNTGGNSYQPQGDRNLLSYRSNNYIGPPGFNQSQNQNGQNRNQNFNQNQNQNRMNQGFNNQGNFNSGQHQVQQNKNQRNYNRNLGQNN